MKLGAFLEYRTLHRQTLPACLITVRGVTVPGQADKCLVLVSNLLFGQNYNTHHPLNIIMVPYGDDNILSWWHIVMT